MSAREIIAHAAWRHEATSGAPSSVANARTLEAFADAGPIARDKWLSSADAILAAMPDMIAPLVWNLVGDWDYRSGEYAVFLSQRKTTPKPVWILDAPFRMVAKHGSKEAAKAAANAHHRAAIMAALTGEAKT
jgi:hypothetical protein